MGLLPPYSIVSASREYEAFQQSHGIEAAFADTVLRWHTNRHT